MTLKDDIRALLRLRPDEVIDRAGERLIVCDDLDALHERMADDIAAQIRLSMARSTPLRLILPVGPTGQYPALVEKINTEKLSLANCWLFFMDEYCDDTGQAVSTEHPLSFRRTAEDLFLGQLNAAAALNRAQVFFPNETNITALPGIIDDVGGIDTCYGGIGIHGHVAFNEPEPGVSQMGCRKVRLNDFTVTINAVRAGVGGNLEAFPREAYTLGMREILTAGQIRLYCRNGGPYDWANTVLRLALFGEPTDLYPVTHIRPYNYVIVTDRETLQTPVNLI